MQSNVAWSFAFGAIGYVLFLGVGVAYLVFYNFYNNLALQKARQRQEIELWRDSLVDNLDAKGLGTFARSLKRPTSLATTLTITLAARVESPNRCSRSSFFDDHSSIDKGNETQLSMPTILSAGSHDSTAREHPPELTALAIGNQDGGINASTGSSLESVYSFSDSCLH